METNKNIIFTKEKPLLVTTGITNLLLIANDYSFLPTGSNYKKSTAIVLLQYTIHVPGIYYTLDGNTWNIYSEVFDSNIVNAYIDNRVEEVLNANLGLLQTLRDLEDALNNDDSALAAITQELSNKVDKALGMGLSANDYTTIEKNKLSSLFNYDDTQVYTDIYSIADTKVDKLVGYGLSKNDYTDIDKAKVFLLKSLAYEDTLDYNSSLLINKPTIPTLLSNLQDDNTHRLVTDVQIDTWNNKSNFTGSYNDLSDKPTIPDAIDISGKIDKVFGATVGNFTSLTSTGNIVDSLYNVNSFELFGNSTIAANIAEQNANSYAEQLIVNLKDGVPIAGDSLLKLYNLTVSNINEISVEDITERDAYDVPSLPFQIFVVDDGDGKWALYKAITIGVNATYVKLSDYDILNAVLSATQVKIAYESNADTNCLTNALLNKLNSLNNYILPIATNNVLGGVKVDNSTITIDINGVISSTNIPTNNILYWDNTNKWYSPYSVKTNSKFYSGTDIPTYTTRLNYDGYFYATKLFNASGEITQFSIPIIADNQTNSIKLSTNTIHNNSGLIDIYLNTSTRGIDITNLNNNCAINIWNNGTSAGYGIVIANLQAGEGQYIANNGSGIGLNISNNNSGTGINISSNSSNSAINISVNSSGKAISISSSAISDAINIDDILKFRPKVSDSNIAVAYTYGLVNNLTTSGALHSRWNKSDGSFLMTLDKDGNINIPSGAEYRIDGISIGTGIGSNNWDNLQNIPHPVQVLSGTNTGDQDLTELIPYIGATKSVNLGENSIKLSKIKFNLIDDTILETGDLRWNAHDLTIELKTKDSILQINQEQVAPLKNKTGSTLLNGRFVRITGFDNSDGHDTIEYSDNSTEETAIIDYMLTADILDGEVGIGTKIGKVRDLNTSSGTLSGIVYLGKNGQHTSILPIYPNKIVVGGQYGNISSTTGTIIVSISRSNQYIINTITNELELRATQNPGICQKCPIHYNDIIVDPIGLTVTIATIKNGETISASNPIRFFTDGDGIITKHEKISPVIFNYNNTTGYWYFYFDSNGDPISSQVAWNNFNIIAPIYRLNWNATLSGVNRLHTEIYEAHLNDESAATHAHQHAQGAIWINGFDICSNLINNTSGVPNNLPNTDGRNTVFSLSTGKCQDDNLPYIVTNSISVNKFNQNLGNLISSTLNSTNSGLFKIRINDINGLPYTLPATRFPFHWDSVTNRPMYITANGTFVLVTTLRWFVYYVYSIQDPRNGEAIRIVSEITDFTTYSLAQSSTWDNIKSVYPTLNDNEIRPLYKCIYYTKNTTGTAYPIECKYSALVQLIDIRKEKFTSVSSASGSILGTGVIMTSTTHFSSSNVQSLALEIDEQLYTNTFNWNGSTILITKLNGRYDRQTVSSNLTLSINTTGVILNGTTVLELRGDGSHTLTLVGFNNGDGSDFDNTLNMVNVILCGHVEGSYVYNILTTYIDTQANPTLQSLTASNSAKNKIVGVTDILLDGSSIPSISDFIVTEDTGSGAITKTTSSISIVGKNFEVIMINEFVQASTIRLSYTAGANPIRASIDRNLINFTNSLVTNNVTNPIQLNYPANFTATAASTSQLNLTWSAVVGASNYAIYHSIDNINFSVLTTPNQSTTSYSHSGLAISSTHYYYILSIGDGLNYLTSSNSLTIQAITSSASALSSPILNTPTITGNTSQNITWEDVSNETGYQIQVSTDGNTWSNLNGQLAADTLSIDNTGLSIGTTYYYRGQAIGTGQYSNSAFSSAVNKLQLALLFSSATTSTDGTYLDITLNKSAVSGLTGIELYVGGISKTYTLSIVSGKIRLTPTIAFVSADVITVASNGSNITASDGTTLVDFPQSTGVVTNAIVATNYLDMPFNGTSIDTSKITISNPNTSTIHFSQNNRLDIVLDSASSAGYANNRMETVDTYTNDTVISAVLNLSNNAQAYALNFQLNKDINNRIYISPASNGSLTATVGVVQGGVTLLNTSTGVTINNRWKIKIISNVVQFYYHNGTAWTKVGSDVTINFAATGFKGHFAVDTGAASKTAYIDDLYVRSTDWSTLIP